MSAGPPLHIVEPRLTGDTGHCLSLVRALAGAAAEAGAGDRLTIWGGSDAAATWRGPGVLEPRFRPGWRRLQSFLLLRRLLRAPGRVLISTAGTADLVTAHWAAAGPIPAHKLFLFVHWVGAKANKTGLLARIAARQPQLQILAPTTAVAELFTRCGFQVRTVPYPVEAGQAQDPVAPEPFRHLLVAGGARLDKGFGLIVDLVDALRARGSTIPIVVQTSAEPQHLKDRALAGALERLRGSDYGGLRLLPQALDPAAYRALFDGAVVLQPYDAHEFADRVSGVTLDALAAGAPVVATAGTWMARLVAAERAGQSPVEPGAGGLLRAMDLVLADYPGYAARARQASARLRAEHSARALIDVVLGAA